MAKYLIFNADDFGSSPGINQGIVEAHVRGVVTSTSLMVTRGAASQAAAMAGDHPQLSLGLHWTVDRTDGSSVDSDDPLAVRRELEQQLDRFTELTGAEPTHLDSHHHVHRAEHLMPIFREVARSLGIPLRGDAPVHVIGGFYAQWEWQVTNAEYVSVGFLQKLLQEEVAEGWTEISCHPGRVDQSLRSVYTHERELELETLTDPRIRETLQELGIALRSYRDWSRGAI